MASQRVVDVTAQEALEKQRFHYEAVLSLCDQESQAIGTGDADRLMRILQEKQDHMSQIARLNDSIEASGAGTEGALEKELVDLWKLINLILEKEKENEKGILSLMEDLRCRMRALGRKRQVLERYAGGQPHPRYLDRRK